MLAAITILDGWRVEGEAEDYWHQDGEKETV